MRGVNAEVGYHFTAGRKVNMYAAAGPYYFNQEGKNAIGGEGRLQATFRDRVRLSVNGSYDPIFKGIVQGELSLIIPFGPI